MPRRQAPLTFIITAVLATVLVLAGVLGWLRPLQSLTNRVLSPVASTLYKIGGFFRSSSTEGKSVQQLTNELSSAQTEIRKLTTEKAALSGVAQENNSLRNYLKFIAAKPADYQLAEVIARGRAADTWQSQQTLTLNRGSREGLKVGMAVIDAEGVLLGRLTNVSDATAEACLLFDAECRIAVGIEGQSGTIGVIQSDLNLTVKVDYIAQNRSITNTQTIVTSGLEANMPANLVVGKVTAVIRQGNELWQHAVIRPLGNFSDIKIVAVIK